ncbi:MAG TPA: nucleotidyl transferase AbiEii/AbiGii toxin family protein [Streptosporangiaceae bacterium]
MTITGLYSSPTAFRRGLTDRLRVVAQTSEWSLPQLQRQVAYDRLLERLYLADDSWILKGATALLARGFGVRGTRDIDLFRRGDRTAAERDLRDCAAHDIGDWFRFELGASHPMLEKTRGTRIPVTAYIGTQWAEFHIDLLGPDVRITGQPDGVPPLVPLAMAGVEQHGYRAYPLVNHVADKITAIYQRHGVLRRPSTRYRDLVDMVAIVTSADIAAGPQLTALKAESAQRGITLPGRFSVPDRSLWTAGYAASAGGSLLRQGRTLDTALRIVRPFADPLLAGSAAGYWDHRGQAWTG